LRTATTLPAFVEIQVAMVSIEQQIVCATLIALENRG
jgi:hypothetical protein